MQTIVRMPNLGAEAASGRITNWLRSVGETVAAGDVIAEIETDKATVELESPHAGVIAEIVAAPGDDVPVGEPLAVIEHD